MALGTIPVTDASGFTTSKHIGVVTGLGGTGSATSCPANGVGPALGPALMVVDFSQTYAQGSPYTPAPVGFVQLPTSATDVILQGTIALVSTGTNILLINLENPANPLLAGQITGNFGNGIALTDTGIIITSSPTPSTGSVETAEIASPCASARKRIKSNPPNAAAMSVAPSGKLAWSMSAGVSSVQSPNSGGSLSSDGLVLTNVNLGRRMMAKMMSLPYFLLGRSDDAHISNPARCELSANGAAACSGLGSGYPGRSQLTKFEKTTSSDGTYETVQATYLIDQLDGDAEKDTTRPDSCVLLTQSYKFTQEGLKPFEPNGKLATGRFFPTVHYSYFTSTGGPQLTSLTTAQRLQFDARSIPSEPKAPANATLLTCDHDSPFSSSPSCAFTSTPTSILPDFVGIVGGGSNNPMGGEVYQDIIQDGKEILASPGSLQPTIIDNYHQSPQPAATSDRNQAIDLPTIGLPGCSGCVHIHWRWSDVLEADSIPGFLQSLVGAPVDPTFDNNGGRINIPTGSTQDVAIAIETSGTVHPQAPTEVRDLDKGKSVLPSDLTQSPTFWYLATGHQASDTFFQHGGAFSSTYLNKISYPSSGPLTLNIEHSHDTDYVVQVQYQLPPVGTLVPSLVNQVQGTLTGTDDISISGGTLTTLVPLGFTYPFLVSIKLTDKVTGASTSGVFGYTQPDTKPREP